MGITHGYIVDLSEMFSYHVSQRAILEAQLTLNGMDKLTEVALEIAMHYNAGQSMRDVEDMVTEYLRHHVGASELSKTIIIYALTLQRQLMGAIINSVHGRRLNYIKVVSAHLDGMRHPRTRELLPVTASLYLEVITHTC